MEISRSAPVFGNMRRRSTYKINLRKAQLLARVATEKDTETDAPILNRALQRKLEYINKKLEELNETKNRF